MVLLSNWSQIFAVLVLNRTRFTDNWIGTSTQGPKVSTTALFARVFTVSLDCLLCTLFTWIIIWEHEWFPKFIWQTLKGNFGVFSQLPRSWCAPRQFLHCLRQYLVIWYLCELTAPHQIEGHSTSNSLTHCKHMASSLLLITDLTDFVLLINVDSLWFLLT